MKAGDIAALMTAGFAQPSGPEDSAFHTGQIITWDELSGVNTVQINGVILSNLKIIQSGIGVTYSAGDVVVIMRKQTQYFIMGKVAAPGAGLTNQIQATRINTQQGTTSTTYTDLATVGPSITATIGSSRRALVLGSARLITAGSTTSGYTGGDFNIAVSGASTLAAGVLPGASFQIFNGAAQSTQTQMFIFTNAQGLNAGSNTFTMKYLNYNAAWNVLFEIRQLTVIPF